MRNRYMGRRGRYPSNSGTSKNSKIKSLRTATVVMRVDVTASNISNVSFTRFANSFWSVATT
jgi:hypothetical protein